MALSGWDSDKKIPVSVSPTSEALVNFPVMLKISAASGLLDTDLTAVFAELGANSLKIALEVGDTGVQTYIEIELWDNINELAVLHFLCPSTSGISSTQLYLYYDSAHADNTDYVGVIGSVPGRAVWDDNFVVVYHLSQDPSGGNDSIINSTSASFTGDPANMDASNLVDGAVGKAIVFDGSDESIRNIVAHSDFNIDTLTVEAIITDPNDGAVLHTIFHHGDFTVSSNQGQYYSIYNGKSHVGYYNGGWRSLSSTENLPATRCHVAWAMDAANFIPYFDGVAQTPKEIIYALGNSTNVSTIGACKSGSSYTNHFVGQIDELRYSKVNRSTAWLAATSLSLTDSFLVFELLSVVACALEQRYGAGWVEADLEQRCGLYLDAALEQEYHLLDFVAAALEQRCGLMLDAVLSQRYGDAAAPVVALYQYYGDTSLPAVALVQPYDDTLLSVRALEQDYHLMYDAVAGLVQEYAICEGLLSKALEQIYSLKDLDPVTRALVQAYGLLGDPARSPVCGIAVVADDQAVDPWQVEVSHDLGSYISKCTVHLRSHGQWQSIQRLGDLQVYDGTITYHYFIESKPRARTRSGAGQYEADYQLIGLSKTAALDAPYAVPVTMEWASGGMASAIAEDLIDLAGMGLALDWRIVDWFIGPDLFFLTDETPLSGLRRLIADRGVLQTDVDGVTLIVKREDEVSPVNYAAATPTYTLTDEYDFTTAGDQPEIHPLYNTVLISDQLASTSAGFRIESNAVSAIEAMVKVYRTPWGGTWTLRTSGGAWVTIEDLGVVTETITEQVEFVDGVGRAGYPVYAQVSLSWLQTSLGGVIFSEDGQLVSGTAGNSLAEFAYTTKYRKYRVKSDRVEAVQFYVEEL